MFSVTAQEAVLILTESKEESQSILKGWFQGKANIAYS